MGTVTGENFQPVRLHYRVFDHEGLLRVFKKLRCVKRDPTQPRWCWLYEDEARNLRFKHSYADLPPHLRPVVIGSLFPRGEDHLLLDLRSCERALHALPFFDKHVPRKVARVTEAEVVNKLFPTDDPTLTPDRLFDHQQSTSRDPKALVRRITELADRIEDPQAGVQAAMEEMQAGARQPLPEIERLPIHYYEDGIHGFELALRVRQIVALQHWLGNSGYTLQDAIQEVCRPG
jgi:hypothetical protein